MQFLKQTYKHYLLNSLIYLFSFLLVHYIKYNSFLHKSEEVTYIIGFLASWFLASVMTGKYSQRDTEEARGKIKSVIVSFFLMCGLLGVFLLIFEFDDLSRYLIVGSMFLGFIIELTLSGIIGKKDKKVGEVIELRISLIPLITEVVVLTYTLWMLFTYILKIDSLDKIDIVLLSGIYGSWIISSLFTHQFAFDTAQNYWRVMWGYIKSYIILGALTTFLLIVLRIDPFIRTYLLLGILIFAVFSLLILSFIFISRHPVKSDEVRLKLVRATEIIEESVIRENGKSSGKYSFGSESFSHYLAEQLSQIYLKKFPEVYKFIEDKLDVMEFDFRKCIILRSSDTYNIEVMPEDSLELYVNLHKINDMRRINYYAIEVNKKLQNGGVFIGCVEPNHLRFRRFLHKYPLYLARFFYLNDFIWKRMVPKLPVVKKLYFSLTRGKNRAISLSESLGRLYYSGFEVIGLKNIEGLIYFIVKKVREPLEDKDPSYGPFIKLKRVGKEGKIINVYKLRTMHPYSEYLQKFVFDLNELEEGGKLRDDFRITSWGKLLRKLWLDELPMYINFFKGELKLFGVRPLSRHYFELYRDDLRERRIKYKPGLVPPFYVDLPKTLPEIMDSEEKYLDAYDKSPVLTDIKYFCKAWWNILIKRARSG